MSLSQAVSFSHPSINIEGIPSTTPTCGGQLPIILFSNQMGGGGGVGQITRNKISIKTILTRTYFLTTSEIFLTKIFEQQCQNHAYIHGYEANTWIQLKDKRYKEAISSSYYAYILESLEMFL